MPDKRHVVQHTQVTFSPRTAEEPIGKVLSAGDLIDREDVGTDAQWERLQKSGAIREATPDEIATAEARAELNEAQETAHPGMDPEQLEELSTQRATAERAIAEPPARIVDGQTVPAAQNFVPGQLTPRNAASRERQTERASKEREGRRAPGRPPRQPEPRPDTGEDLPTEDEVDASQPAGAPRGGSPPRPTQLPAERPERAEPKR